MAEDSKTAAPGGPPVLALKLTEDQKKSVAQLTGRHVESLELSATQVQMVVDPWSVIHRLPSMAPMASAALHPLVAYISHAALHPLVAYLSHASLPPTYAAGPAMPPAGAPLHPLVAYISHASLPPAYAAGAALHPLVAYLSHAGLPPAYTAGGPVDPTRQG